MLQIDNSRDVNIYKLELVKWSYGELFLAFQLDRVDWN
jgi:hypothetical protein